MTPRRLVAGGGGTSHTAVFDDVSVDELRKRRSYKWTAYPPHVLPAFVAEMDCALAEPVARALIEAVQLGDTGYAWHNDELTDAFLAFARTAFAWEIDARRLTVVPDVLVAITELLRAALRPGDGVIVNTPVSLAISAAEAAASVGFLAGLVMIRRSRPADGG